ncbi:NAD kinase 2, mitochondrial [Lonchura striata]|uniref:NAD(+) kinase n=1 Tax=Lonchura striata TaxID=40157 RepID=A0A218UVY1_9PASE|nr:NAD kinase 2, mitochondrial [Lonchura striata domestica]
MFSSWGFPCGRIRLAGRTAARCSALVHQRTAASSATPWLPLLGGAHRRLLALGGLSPFAAAAAAGRGAAGAAPCASGAAGGGFRPSRVAVVVKTTRYEFEQQRYRYAGLSEEDLKQLVDDGRLTADLAMGCAVTSIALCNLLLPRTHQGIDQVLSGTLWILQDQEISGLALKGSNYAGLLERHRIHTKNVEHVVDSLRNERIEVRLVKRREYNEETVRWADAVISAGGDGTMLLAASKVFDKFKPVIGINTDPERSEGHLCLPVRYTHSFPEALQKLYRGEFRWQWRQRIRLYLEGTGINTTPVDLHEQQLSQEQHSRAHINERFQDQRSDISGPHLLPVRALNEVFIGESLSSRENFKSCKPSFKFSLHRASYYEISVDDGPWEKQKSSGLNVCTGTGSKAWSYNINKVAHQAIEEILKIVTNDYNESLLYSPEEPKMFFSVREPIVNRVFSSSRQRGFSSKVCVRSRCWDACMVVDGGTSFEFNDGAIASILIDTEDSLCTVLLEE